MFLLKLVHEEIRDQCGDDDGPPADDDGQQADDKKAQSGLKWKMPGYITPKLMAALDIFSLGAKVFQGHYHDRTVHHKTTAGGAKRNLAMTSGKWVDPYLTTASYAMLTPAHILPICGPHHAPDVRSANAGCIADFVLNVLTEFLMRDAGRYLQYPDYSIWALHTDEPSAQHAKRNVVEHWRVLNALERRAADGGS